MKYTISEARFKEIIKESIEEGIADAIKSGLWKAKNVYTQSNDVKRQNTKPYNPYTYNKKNFHQSSPDYGTKEFNKMYNADDGWVMGHIQRDIDNMQKFLKGENEYNETLMGFVPKDIQMANEYGLTKYAEYLKQLYQSVQQKMNS